MATNGIRTKVQPWAAGFLTLGLLAAVALDGDLPGSWSRALFGVLMVLNLVTIDWLTRPRVAPRSGR